MQARRLEYDDYELLCQWWREWRWEPPTRDMLPGTGTSGMILFDDSGTPLCAGFLYTTNSHMAWVEFIVSNPHVKTKAIRRAAITKLIDGLSGVAKSEGYKVCYTVAVNESLINKYIECGYTKTGSGYTELIKKL